MKPNVSNAGCPVADARRTLAPAVVAVAVWALWPAAAQAEPPSMDQVERAVLAADAGSASLERSWAPVIRLLVDVNARAPDPVLRMVKGHACLAANQNNESVCLFLSVQTPEDKEHWLRWAEGFAGRHSIAPIAHYFHGDALARMERWDDAVDRFTMAINKAPNEQHALAFDGRGVVHVAKGAVLAASGGPDAGREEYRAARTDFTDAFTYSGHRLADAQANIGALALQRKDGPGGGIKAFNKALSGLSPHFALALHGRGCLKLVDRDLEGAKEDLEAALAHAPCDQTRALMRANQLRMHAHSGGMIDGHLLGRLSVDDETGATIGGAFGSAIGGIAGTFIGSAFGGPIGGVDLAVPSDIKWDEGLWPFAGYFTLAYRNHSIDFSVAERRP